MASRGNRSSGDGNAGAPTTLHPLLHSWFTEDDTESDYLDYGTDDDNGTCHSLIDMNLFLHYSLIPSVLIILVLSFLERRSKRKKIDNELLHLDGRFGFVIPLDLIGNFNNRWTFGFAFGAMAYTIMSLEEYLPHGLPGWAKAIGLLVGAFEVGLSYYPIFACLTTDSQMVGSVIGFLYTLIWFTVTVVDITTCPDGYILGYLEKVIFEWPSLLCLVFLVGRFFHMFIKCIRIHLGADIQNDEKCFLQKHQAEHVKRLFQKPTLERKNWFQRKIYTWDPCFRFPSRMIGTTVLSLLCLYIFISLEYSIHRALSYLLNSLETMLELLGPSYNHTVYSVHEFSEAFTIVWFFTTFLSCVVTVSYILHILVCYRKHIRKLWVGDKSFLPKQFQNPLSSQCVAAIARYSGWQVAYILWGYWIMHVIQILLGMVFVCLFVFPIKHGKAAELLKGLGFSILTFAIAFSLSKLQYLMASRFFLQKKIIPEDKQKPLALNNSLILGSWLIGRIDRSILQRGYESFDSGFKTWIGMIYVDHFHTNPVLVSFCSILLTMSAEKRLKEMPISSAFRDSGGPRTSSVKSRTRWLLYYTLLNNPRLILYRKKKQMDDAESSNTVLKTRLLQATVLEVGNRDLHQSPKDTNGVDI
ncbi:hypothetical protein GDO81_001448 [Engystomops pustulosus]|uniref:Stimulated by retinoic acid gene 6 protein-like n=1 Tax=Engystomops pustulosus TaxID=76066 RepID=A0AAV7DCJ9_ENGPU|nr:hypothetical protein GDO81_001448 [Engystomops pustulosus]